MSTKHTPGPFKLDKLSESSWYICNRDKYVVCCVMRNDYMPKEEREANAALFLAAPDLLAELKRATAVLDNIFLNLGKHNIVEDGSQCLFLLRVIKDRVEAYHHDKTDVIAKTEGGG